MEGYSGLCKTIRYSLTYDGHFLEKKSKANAQCDIERYPPGKSRARDTQPEPENFTRFREGEQRSRRATRS